MMKADPLLDAGYADALGVRIERSNESLVEGTMVAGPEHAAAGGGVHGGVLMAFAEALCATGRARTLDSSTHFVAAAGQGVLRGVSRAISRTPATQVWHTEIRDADEVLVAVVTQTRMLAEAPAPRLAAVHPIAPQEPAGDPGTIPEQRLRQIVNAASQVFGKSGYAGASMRDVAAAAGMPIATMYQYVSGKEKLLLLIFETYMAEISAALAQADDAAKRPRERLRDCVEATLRLYDKYRRQIRLIHQEGRMLTPENKERVKVMSRSTQRVWRGIIRDGVAAGDFSCGDVAITANFIPALCSTWVLRYTSIRGTSLEKLRDAILELIEGGLRVAASTQKRARAKP